MIILFLLSFLITSSVQGMELSTHGENNTPFPLQELSDDTFAEITKQITSFHISDASETLRALACTSKKFNKLINNDTITQLYVQAFIENHIDFFNGYADSFEKIREHRKAIASLIIGTQSTKLLHTPDMFPPDLFNHFLDESFTYTENGLLKKNQNGYNVCYNIVTGRSCLFETSDIFFTGQDSYNQESVNPFVFFYALKHKNNSKLVTIIPSGIPCLDQDYIVKRPKIHYHPFLVSYLIETGQKAYFNAHRSCETTLSRALSRQCPLNYIEAHIQNIDINSPNLSDFFYDKDEDLYFKHENNQLTPLCLAAKYAHCQALHLFLKHGANPNLAIRKTKKSPLHFAAEYGSLACATRLVQDGAMIDARTNMNITPLMLAVHLKYWEVADYLLDCGANPNITSESLQTWWYDRYHPAPRPKASYIAPKKSPLLIATDAIIDICGRINYLKDNGVKEIGNPLEMGIRFFIRLLGKKDDPNYQGGLALYKICSNSQTGKGNVYPYEFGVMPISVQYELIKHLIENGLDRDILDKKEEDCSIPLFYFLENLKYAIEYKNEKSQIHGFPDSDREYLQKIISLLVTPQNVFERNQESNMNLQDYLNHFGIEATPQIIQAQQEWKKRNSMNIFGGWALGTAALITLKFFTK